MFFTCFRGLGGRTSKERNNPPEEIQCHPVSRQSYKPREGKEISLSVKEYLPPAEHKNFLLDANRSSFDTEFHHTCSSGIYVSLMSSALLPVSNW